MRKLPINEELTAVQKKLLLLWIEQGAKEANSKALRDLGGFTLTDAKQVDKWVKRKIEEEKSKKATV